MFSNHNNSLAIMHIESKVPTTFIGYMFDYYQFHHDFFLTTEICNITDITVCNKVAVKGFIQKHSSTFPSIGGKR